VVSATNSYGRLSRFSRPEPLLFHSSSSSVVELLIFLIQYILTVSNSYCRRLDGKMYYISFSILISSLCEEIGVRHFPLIRHITSQYLHHENRENTAAMFRCSQFRPVRLGLAQLRCRGCTDSGPFVFVPSRIIPSQRRLLL
jgi:hypothetical protein